MDYCTTIPNGGSKNNTSSIPTSEVAGSSSSSSSTSKGTNNKKNKKGNNTKKISTNNNNNNSNKGVMKLSTDPQSVAARERRHRISDRFKILQSMVPGGTKMDTVSMLEEAIHYVKFLKTQIWLHQTMMMMNNNNNYFVDVNDESSPKMLLSSTDQCYNFSVSEQSNNVPMIQQNTSSELPLGQGIITFDDHSIFKTWQP